MTQKRIRNKSVNTVESILGRQGVPRFQTIHNIKRCLGALEAMNGDIEAAIENLTITSLRGTKKPSLSEASIRYYVGTCSRLPASEQKRLRAMSAENIVTSIAMRVK